MAGALDGMASGRVNIAWARHHHDLWYVGMKQSGQVQDLGDSDERQRRLDQAMPEKIIRSEADGKAGMTRRQPGYFRGCMNDLAPMRVVVDE